MKTRVQLLPIFAALLSMVVALWGCGDISVLTAFKTAEQGKPNASGQVATPAFSLAAGTYGGDQSVTIGCSTSGATIYCTTDGTIPTTASAAYGSAIAVAGDGTAMTIKAIAAKSGMSDSAVAQASYTLHYSGTLDTSFLATGAGANGKMFSVAVQSDGKALICGLFTVYNSSSRGHIARVNSDGSLDTGFLTDVGADNYLNSVAVQNDGKVLIGGYFTTYNGTSRGNVARLGSDGTLDTGFLTGTGANNVVNSVAVQNDGKVLIGGYFTAYNGTSRGYVARLDSDGSLDTGFLATGAGTDNAVYSVAVQSDGKILIGGYFTAYNGTSRGNVARLNSNGSLDTGFLATGVGANATVTSVAVQSDGKILIGGYFTAYNGTSRGHIARLNGDGSLDTGFLAAGAGANNFVSSVAVQSDGKVLIGGAFSTYNGTSRGGVARLDSNGSLDTGFLAAGAGVNNSVSSVAVQSDGKILIGGDFSTYNGTIRGYVARLWN